MPLATEIVPLQLESLRDCFGLGVAGNFAGHLEQAGEAGDFSAVEAESAQAPKGIFPWYEPGAKSFLGRFPLSTTEIAIPAAERSPDVQIEPEAAVLFAVTSADKGVVLEPRLVAAFNDCSIRRPGARKISEKKNWGRASKGIAARGFRVSELDPDGATSTLRLTCFLRRDEETHAYGVDSPLPGYSYYGNRLVEWLGERLDNQAGSDETPLEPVGEFLRRCGSARVLAGIGATRYTPFGETHFLRPGDDSIVVVYDATAYTASDIQAAIVAGAEQELKAASVLTQRVTSQ